MNSFEDKSLENISFKDDILCHGASDVLQKINCYVYQQQPVWN